MSHSLRDIEPSGSGIALFVCVCVFPLSTVNVDACRWICLQAFRGRCERRWGSPTWGRPWRPHPPVCVNHLDRGPQVYVCASFTSIMQTVFAQPWAANEQRLDCWLYGVKCQLSVVHIILTGAILLHYFSASPFVYVKVLIYCQRGSSPQWEPLGKLIDHSHFSCCAADMHGIWSNYSCFCWCDGLLLHIDIFQMPFCPALRISILVHY